MLSDEINHLKVNFRLFNMSRINLKMKKNKEEKHVCRLPPEEEVLVTFINEGYFVILRREFRKFFMLDENSRYSKMCFKSMFLIERAKKAHLKNNYYMIHPFSKFKEYGDIVVAAALLLSAFTIYQSTKCSLNYFSVHVDLDFICDVILTLDIVRTFATGIYRQDLNDADLRFRRVACKYIKGWLINDLLTIAPNHTLRIFCFIENDYFERKDTKDVVLMLNLLFITRIIKFLRLINIIQDCKQFASLKFKPFRLLSITTMIIIWISYELCMVIDFHGYKAITVGQNIYHDHSECNFFGVVVHCFFIFFLHGTTNEPPDDTWVLFIEIILINLGYCFYLYSSIQFIQLIKMYNVTMQKNQLLESRLRLYSDCKNVPEAVKMGLLEAFEFKFHRTYFHEELIMSYVTGQVNKDLLEFYAEKFVSKVEIFRVVPIAHMVQIMKIMESKIFLTNSTICKAGFKGDSMHFIYQGTVAIYSKNGKEVGHLYDGDYFGEIQMFQKRQIRVATVKAVETSRIFLISFENFKNALVEYPEVIDSISKMASSRLDIITQ